MDITYSTAAEKARKAMPKADRARLDAKIADYAANPDQPGAAKAMVGDPGGFRIRAGDWRAICRVHQGRLRVDRIAHRKDIYR